MRKVLARAEPVLYSLLRIVAGLLYAQHGAQKLFGLLGGQTVPLASQAGLAGIIEFFGLQHTPTIEAWIPIFLFSVLFGLSMDYHVFLLSRIREHYDETGDNSESVAVGLKSTGRIITGAALIMVAVFSGFAAGRLVMFQQLGFGLGVAVLIDATLIRTVLVPSAMALLGDRNWYMPKWLSWLPDLRVEGSPIQTPRIEAPIGIEPPSPSFGGGGGE